MLKKILLIIAIGLAAFLAFVATRPAHFEITRSAVLPATPDRVHALINDFHQWERWSPWAKLDPQAVNTFTGPASGPGASMSWSGNDEVGEGSMTITSSVPGQSVALDLVFKRPMEAKNLTQFTLKPDPAGTAITWTMSGENGFVGKCFSILMDCDAMVGGQFEKGLANMAAVLRGTAP